MTIHNQPPRLYLASRSPRRRELLAQIGVTFDTLFFRSGARADAEVDETPLPGEAPLDYVQRVARAKAEHGVRIAARRRHVAAQLLWRFWLDSQGQAGHRLDALAPISLEGC